MDQDLSQQIDKYRILVKECLDRKMIDWFGDLTITPIENGGTMLSGTFPDQPALRGFLEQLWNLNITVITVEKVQNEN
jgi:hypothetical protein